MALTREARLLAAVFLVSNPWTPRAEAVAVTSVPAAAPTSTAGEDATCASDEPSEDSSLLELRLAGRGASACCKTATAAGTRELSRLAQRTAQYGLQVVRQGIEAYDPREVGQFLGESLFAAPSRIFGLGAALFPNTSNYAGCYRCFHPYRRDTPWCQCTESDYMLWIVSNEAPGTAGEGKLYGMSRLPNGTWRIDREPFYASGAAFPPNSTWYGEAVGAPLLKGVYSTYGCSFTVEADDVRSQSTFVQAVPSARVEGAVYVASEYDVCACCAANLRDSLDKPHEPA